MPQEFEPREFQEDRPSPPGSAPIDPALQRVTPEELQAALGALEGRPGRSLPAAGVTADVAHVPDTLSLGEAADALGLSIDPEELWREVQAQREQKEKAAEEQAERERLRQERVRQEQASRPQPPPFGQVPPLHTPSVAAGLVGQGARSGWRRGGFRWWIRAALAVFVLSRVFAGFTHHVLPIIGPVAMVNGDGQTQTVPLAGGTVTVNGDGDTVTVNGEGKAVIVNGAKDTVRVRGHVKAIVLNGDGSHVTYPATPAPSVVNNGDHNTALPE